MIGVLMSIAWPQGLLLGNWLVYCIDDWWEFSSVTIGLKKKTNIIDDLEYSPIFIGQSIAVDSCHSATPGASWGCWTCWTLSECSRQHCDRWAAGLWSQSPPLKVPLNMKHSPRIPHIRKSPTRLVNPGFGGVFNIKRKGLVCDVIEYIECYRPFLVGNVTGSRAVPQDRPSTVAFRAGKPCR